MTDVKEGHELTFDRLLDIVDELITVKAGSIEAEAASVFLRKMRYHASSFSVLWRAPNHLDPFSLLALMRIIADCMGTLHHLIDPEITHEEKALRIYVWRLHGLLKRQKFPPSTGQARLQIAQESVTIEQLKRCIQNNSLFSSLLESQQNRLLKGKPETFIIEGQKVLEIGFGEKLKALGYGDRYAVHGFAYQSGHIHSGYDAMIQVGQATSSEQLNALAAYLPDRLMAMLAKAINVAAKTCPEWATYTLGLPRIEQYHLRVLRELGVQASDVK